MVCTNPMPADGDSDVINHNNQIVDELNGSCMVVGKKNEWAHLLQRR